MKGDYKGKARGNATSAAERRLHLQRWPGRIIPQPPAARCAMPGPINLDRFEDVKRLLANPERWPDLDGGTIATLVQGQCLRFATEGETEILNETIPLYRL